jgi:hypothetical protein
VRRVNRASPNFDDAAALVWARRSNLYHACYRTKIRRF